MATQKVQYSRLFLRLGLSLTMLSAVADRFGFWGENSAWGNWDNFEKYTKQLTFFLPESLGVFSAYMATFFEILFPLMLILGFKTTFALSMTIALGVNAPLDYSVWIGSAAAFLLASQQDYNYSLDTLTKKN